MPTSRSVPPGPTGERRPFPVRFAYEWNDAGDESELLPAPRIQKDYRGHQSQIGRFAQHME